MGSTHSQVQDHLIPWESDEDYERYVQRQSKSVVDNKSETNNQDTTEIREETSYFHSNSILFTNNGGNRFRFLESLVQPFSEELSTIAMDQRYAQCNLSQFLELLLHPTEPYSNELRVYGISKVMLEYFLRKGHLDLSWNAFYEETLSRYYKLFLITDYDLFKQTFQTLYHIICIQLYSTTISGYELWKSFLYGYALLCTSSFWIMCMQQPSSIWISWCIQFLTYEHPFKFVNEWSLRKRYSIMQSLPGLPFWMHDKLEKFRHHCATIDSSTIVRSLNPFFHCIQFGLINETDPKLMSWLYSTKTSLTLSRNYVNQNIFIVVSQAQLEYRHLLSRMNQLLYDIRIHSYVCLQHQKSMDILFDFLRLLPHIDIRWLLHFQRKNTAHEFLARFHKLKTLNPKQFSHVTKENFYNQLTQLVRQVLQSDDSSPHGARDSPLDIQFSLVPLQEQPQTINLNDVSKNQHEVKKPSTPTIIPSYTTLDIQWTPPITPRKPSSPLTPSMKSQTKTTSLSEEKRTSPYRSILYISSPESSVPTTPGSANDTRVNTIGKEKSHAMPSPPQVASFSSTKQNPSTSSLKIEMNSSRDSTASSSPSFSPHLNPTNNSLLFI
jgi:hypothetical protein